jgi:hypothetical protein
MSYEGYEQHICEAGHLFSTDASYMMYNTEDEICPCGMKSVFCNSVDQTNCEEYGTIRNWDSLLLAPTKTETCNTCNHTKLVEEARYRIPTTEELAELREYWDYKKEKWFLIKDYR